MKRSFLHIMLTAAAAAAFVSCAKELDNNIAEAVPGIDVTITTAEDGTTKTVFDDDTHIFWQDGESLGVFKAGETTGVQFDETSISSGTKASASFSGTVTSGNGTYYAIHPLSATTTVAFPANQTAPGYQQFDNNADLMISEGFDVSSANPTVDNLRFYRLGAFVKVTVEDETTGTILKGIENVNKVTLTSSGQTLAGDVLIDMPGHSFTVAANASKSVSVKENGFYAIGSGYTYLGILPATFAAGETLTISIETDSYIIKKVTAPLSSAIDVAAGQILPLSVKVADANLVTKPVWYSSHYMRYNTIQEAVDNWVPAYGTINVSNGTYDENVVIADKGLTIHGNGASTVVTSFEIAEAAATIENLTVKPTTASVPSGIRGTYTNIYPTGIEINVSGYGATISYVTFDLSEGGSNVTAMYIGSKTTDSNTADVVENCTINGSGQRAMQIYDAKAEINNNTINTTYSSYAVRVGTPKLIAGSAVVFNANNFNVAEGTVAQAIHINNATETTITLGDGSIDNNIKGAAFTKIIGGTAQYNVTVRPSGLFKSFHLTRVWGRYGDYTANTYPDCFGLAANQDRTAAMDDKYIYIAKVKDSGFGIKAVDINDPTNVTDVNMTGVSGGTYGVDCVRVIDNPGSDPILICTNLAVEGETLKIYAWTSGITNAPTLLKSFDTTDAGGSGKSFRLGDQFTVSGNWENGILWFRDWKNNGVAKFTVTNGVISDPALLTPFVNGESSVIGAYYQYGNDVSSASLLYASANKIVGLPVGASLDASGAGANADFKLTFGYSFATLGGQKLIIYTRMQRASVGTLRITKDKYGTDAKFFDSVTAKETIVNAYVQKDYISATEEDTPGADALGTYSAQALGSCSIWQKSANQYYVMAHVQNVGMSLFLLSYE